MFTHHRRRVLALVQSSKSKASVQECPTHTSTTHKSMSQRIPLERMYDYRRMVPHYQKARRALFVTFCKLIPTPFAAEARTAILQHCLYDDAKRYLLHAAVVMPEHVHLLLTPLEDEDGWSYGLPATLKLLKGASARSVNKLLGSDGPVWQGESFDHVLGSFWCGREDHLHICCRQGRTRVSDPHGQCQSMRTTTPQQLLFRLHPLRQSRPPHPAASICRHRERGRLHRQLS